MIPDKHGFYLKKFRATLVQADQEFRQLGIRKAVYRTCFWNRSHGNG